MAAKYEVGQLVRGTVTQLANFGAFARIEDGIEGLIHVSELADERITHPKQVVGEGQQLILRIIRIDPQRRRMGLSLRRALDTPDAELIGAFGDEGLAERDRIAQHIRQALEAEGIEPAPPRADRGAAEHTAGEGTVTVEQGPAHPEPADPDRNAAIPGDPAAASQSEVEAPVTAGMAEEIAQAVTGTPSEGAVQATEQAAASAAATPKKARERDQRPQPELPQELQGEELSAFAMALALAGGTDLIEETATEDETSGAETEANE